VTWAMGLLENLRNLKMQGSLVTMKCTAPRRTRNLAPALILLCLLASANPAQAERECEKPAEETGRACTVEVCIALQEIIKSDTACGGREGQNAPERCKGDDSCEVLLGKRLRWNNCVVARKNMIDTCWPNVDSGHARQLDQAVKGVARCDRFIARPFPEGFGDPCADLFLVSSSEQLD